MPCLLSLESFEDSMAQGDPVNEDYNRGYAEGLVAGTAAAKLENAALQEKFVQAICDIDFTYAEARGQLLSSLAPLFTALVAKVLPHCIDTGFAGHLSEELLNAAQRDIDEPIWLYVHPENIASVQAMSIELPARIRLQPDETLDLHAAWIEKRERGTLLDTDALLAEITMTLSMLTNPEARTESHG